MGSIARSLFLYIMFNILWVHVVCIVATGLGLLVSTEIELLTVYQTKCANDHLPIGTITILNE